MKIDLSIFMSCKAGFLLTISLFGQQEVIAYYLDGCKRMSCFLFKNEEFMKEISYKELMELDKDKYILVDTRNEGSLKYGMIPGADNTILHQRCDFSG